MPFPEKGKKGSNQFPFLKISLRGDQSQHQQLRFASSLIVLCYLIVFPTPPSDTWNQEFISGAIDGDVSLGHLNPYSDALKFKAI